jgi:hypothetical protein
VVYNKQRNNKVQWRRTLYSHVVQIIKINHSIVNLRYLIKVYKLLFKAHKPYQETKRGNQFKRENIIDDRKSRKALTIM